MYVFSKRYSANTFDCLENVNIPNEDITKGESTISVRDFSKKCIAASSIVRRVSN